MLVRDDGDGGLLIVLQEDHAHHAGELAAALTEAVPAPQAAWIAAARTHDNGWRESDAAPRLDPRTGRPHTYRSVPDDVYVDVWRRGIDRALALDAYAGLLVSLHGLRFFGNRDTPEARAFYIERRAQQDRLLAELGAPEAAWDRLPEDVRTHHEWLRWVDGLSLFLLGDWGDELELAAAARRHHLRRRDDRTVAMAPFPFAHPLTFRVPALRLAGERYEDERALQAAFADARPEMLSLRLEPA